MESICIDGPDAATRCTQIPTNWASYNGALKRRGSLDVWFDPGMQWLSAPCGRPGRLMRVSSSAIELCLTLKVLFNLPLRQVTGLVGNLLKMAKLDWLVPDYTTLCRRQKTSSVNLGGRPSTASISLARDHRVDVLLIEEQASGTQLIQLLRAEDPRGVPSPIAQASLRECGPLHRNRDAEAARALSLGRLVQYRTRNSIASCCRRRTLRQPSQS